MDSIASFLTALRMDKDTLQKLEKGVERISDSQIRSIVTEMINQTRGNVDAEHRTEHPEWFASEFAHLLCPFECSHTLWANLNFCVFKSDCK